MRKKFDLFWAARSVSERRLLLAWTVIVVAALAWFLAISPLGNRIGQLEKSIPQLEAQLFAMRAQPVQGGPARLTAAAAGDLRSAAFQTLADLKISADLRSISAERIELRLPEMPTEMALAALEKLRQDSAARIVNLTIKHSTAGGPVQVVLEMERGK